MSDSLAEQAYSSIRRLIVTAELAPGSVLSEAELQDSLGLGRTPIREALRTLANDHLVDVYPRRGMFVAGVDVRDLRALSEVRAVLEPFAAGIAAERRDDSDVAAIDQLLAEIREHKNVDIRTLIDLDERIHHRVYAATHNSFLISDLNRYYTHALRIWFLALDNVENLTEAVEEHAELLTAIRDSNARLAVKIMTRHINDFEDEMRKAL
ncbi:MAG: GntR family transcriptional regulator [Candidatus Nanopelagicales bacterium]|nr:GntR family transcriptional regulator [Actinomycetes bacterium]MCH9830388.1 GntR family transcriptional regulator [Actinomycetes bacterium]